MITARSIVVAVVTGATVVTTAAGQTEAVGTSVMVRVLARDAKLVGSSVGGARVMIRDAQTGSVLATGITNGGTGDTDMIMTRRRERGSSIFDSPGAAGWLARLELSRPTMVEITAEGPLGHPDVGARASKTLLLVPGRDVGGDGIVLELNGFIVETLEPEREVTGTTIPVRVRVRMLCSCPTEPGGRWSVQAVTAQLLGEGQVAAESILEFSGETSIYSGAIRAPRPGRYTLLVIAADPATGNFGQASTVVAVPGEGASRF